MDPSQHKTPDNENGASELGTPDDGVSDHTALHFLATHGWLPLVLADLDGFVEAYTDLQKASAAFFTLDETSSEKITYKAVSGAAASEEGYSKIPLEKSILTIKTASHCPEIVKEPAQRAWDLTGTFMNEILDQIARSLQLEPNVFEPLVKPCATLPQGGKTPTLLRMFRYDRPPGPEHRTNAERHKDLGLLSLVVGQSPGLVALDTTSQQWVKVEEDEMLPPETRVRSGGLTGTLLVGETLAILSRGKYKAGAHCVVTAPSKGEAGTDPGEERFRYSLVFTLRPAVAPLWTENFESAVTGQFQPHEVSKGESSAAFFGRIRASHFNVNIAPEIREKQRKKQMEDARKKHKPENENQG